jgi:hypothetical protein
MPRDFSGNLIHELAKLLMQSTEFLRESALPTPPAAWRGDHACNVGTGNGPVLTLGLRRVPSLKQHLHQQPEAQ